MTDSASLKANPERYPADRRHTLWIRPRLLLWLILLVLTPVAVAWAQYLLAGLPHLPTLTIGQQHASSQGVPGFPAWLRIAHYINFLLLVLIARSGLSILMDHPRLYRKVDCTPGTEWIRFTPLKVPLDRLYTANDDQRYLSPLLGLPGYRHTVGMARHWHFLSDLFWVVNGLIYVILVCALGHLTRLAPTSWHVLPQAWNVFVHYATFHIPPEYDGFYRYNAMQQLAYSAVVFLMAPLSVLSGIAMSPAFDNRFQWYVRLFGGRQSARSLHFLLLLGYVAFLVVHVTLVVLTGFERNMDYIVLGVDSGGPAGAIIGMLGIAAVVGICILAHWLAWNRTRAVQQIARHTVGAIAARLLDRAQPRAEYEEKDISPRHWPNGKLPTSSDWLELARDDFRDYRLKVSGLVANPVELSLSDIMAMPKQAQITLHHCIQGWSGIAEWGGLPMAALIELVRPHPEAAVVAFYSYGESDSGSQYYETLSMTNVLHAQTILAYEMNHEPLPHIYGAPLRLRVENQLGFKMVKWLRAIEFVATEKGIGKGFGGTKEDEDFFDIIADI